MEQVILLPKHREPSHFSSCIILLHKVQSMWKNKSTSKRNEKQKSTIKIALQSAKIFIL